MHPESGAALAVASLFVGNPNPVRRSIQLLLDTGDGVRARRWDDLYRDSGLPAPSLHYLFLSPSGRTLLGWVPIDPNADATKTSAHAGHERLVLIDVATAAQTLTAFTRQGRGHNLHYGLCGDDTDLAVAVVRTTSEKVQTTITVVRGPERQVSAERVVPGAVMRYDQMDHCVQWSPNKRLLALWLRLPAEEEAVHVLDAVTLETVLRVDSTTLAGSMSWSPDSERLVVLREDAQRILHLDDGRLEKLTWLNGPRGDPPRQPQILGLLSADRALVQRQRGRRLRLHIVDLSTGKGPVVADVPVDEYDAYVRMSVSQQWERCAPH